MGPGHVRPFQDTLIDVDNRNLVVPYKRVRHQSQLNILYIFYTYFFTRNPVNIMNNSLIEYNLINTFDVSGCYRQV